ncbi:double zinc ribbon domain-containing protein [candidate division CSSED10-310 bacterium]|uniref:Double zinc ribbon domain-containing protein n=1 Tax=candidate division CSSED10-310 bacterium TaxID=2855610 RepID=A0ABV6YV58_UNCC1
MNYSQRRLPLMFRWPRIDQHILNLIYPAVCPVCQQLSSSWKYSPLCQDCWKDITRMPTRCCSACGLPIPAYYHQGDTTADGDRDTILCYDCSQLEKIYISIRSAALYQHEGTLRAALLAFKHGRNLSLVKPLTLLLSEQFRETMALRADELVVPVPLHWSRFLYRGFNQSYLLAKALTKMLPLRLVNDALIRIRRTPPQAGNVKQRRKNVANAFKVKIKKRIKAKNILLIDDVMTTGATLTECAKVLKAAGSAEVRAFTIARVIPSGLYE